MTPFRSLLLVGLLLSAAFVAAEENQLELKSNGLPVGEPETVLPRGAVAHLRANNLAALFTTLDNLVVSFIPEQALPPPMQPMLQQPQPILTFIGTSTLGVPLTADGLGQLLGLALDKPITLTLYPMNPKQEFVLSLPMKDPALLGGMLASQLQPRKIEVLKDGAQEGLHVVTTNPSLPQDLYLVCSNDRVYISGSLQLAKGLFGPAEAHLASSGLIPRALKQYGSQDFTVVVDALALKPMLGMLKMQFGQLPPPLVAMARAELLRAIPPAQQASLNLRLRLQLGVNDLDQGLDYLEALVTATYEVGFAALTRELDALDGVSLSVAAGTPYQKLQISVFSQNIKATDAAAVPMDDVQAAVAKLPGSRNVLNISGRQTPELPSALVNQWLDALKAKFLKMKLPQNGLLAFIDYMHERKITQPLESQVPWTLTTTLVTPGTPKPKPAATLEEYLSALVKQPSNISELTVMPALEENLIEKHYAQEAENNTLNDKAWPAFLTRIEMTPPCYDSSSRFQALNTEGKAKKLVLENIYTTHGGIFGYSQHELINRKIMYYVKSGNYYFVQSGGSMTNTWLNQLDTLPAQPLSQGVAKLLSLTPKDASAVHTCRVLNQLEGVVNTLAEMEDVAHTELDVYLAKVTQLMAAPGMTPKKLDEALASLTMPSEIVSLNTDPATHKPYCVLLGNLRYPRPKVVPALKGLLYNFFTMADSIGGSVCYSRTLAGQQEYACVLSTEALATLVKSTGNAFCQTYANSPEGQTRLMQILSVPGDDVLVPNQITRRNDLWSFLEGPAPVAPQGPQRSFGNRPGGTTPKPKTVPKGEEPF